MAKSLITKLLALPKITINGGNPWDIQVHNNHFYRRLLSEGSLALGESYMDKWWDCPHLDQFIARVLSAKLTSQVKANYRLLAHTLITKLFNLQTKKRALTVGKAHYDLGNDLFSCMLDTRMNYTCGYWKNARTLDEAQEAKLKLSCEKLQLSPGMRILDIGCGFGALAKYAAENYGVSVVGVTISKEQCEYAQKNCAGLPVDIRFQDYRDVSETFDCVVSLGMFEHVGRKNYKTYMQQVKKNLKKGGLFLLHTIGTNDKESGSDPWIHKYIFPNGQLPLVENIAQAAEGLFVMEDWHNFGSDYDKTLLAWYENFTRHWDSLKSRYGERFYRMWTYYLLSCAGAFRARDIQLWQIVFSDNGIAGGYTRVS